MTIELKYYMKLCISIPSETHIKNHLSHLLIHILVVLIVFDDLYLFFKGMHGQFHNMRDRVLIVGRYFLISEGCPCFLDGGHLDMDNRRVHLKTSVDHLPNTNRIQIEIEGWDQNENPRHIYLFSFPRDDGDHHDRNLSFNRFHKWKLDHD